MGGLEGETETITATKPNPCPTQVPRMPPKCSSTVRSFLRTCKRLKPDISARCMC